MSGAVSPPRDAGSAAVTVPALSVRGVTKSYGKDVRALDGVDLDVPAGACVAVLGPSGCGKTTLLRVVAGLERCDQGSVALGTRIVDGTGVPFVPPERRNVALVFQDLALWPHLSVRLPCIRRTA